MSLPFEFPLGSSVNARSSNNLSCYNYSTVEFEAIFSVKVSVASLGVIASAVVILLILISKSYKLFVFRLVVYFMLADIFQAIAHILELIPVKWPRDGMNGIEDVVKVKNGSWEGACVAFGYLDQVTLWMGNVVILWIILYMLRLTHQLKKIQDGVQDDIRQYWSSFKELFGVFLVFIFPFTFNVVPFGLGMYGLSGPWCWIKLSKDGLCENFCLSLALMFIMFYVPLLIIILFSFAGFVAIATILCRGALGKKKVARKVYRRGVKEMMWMSIYPIIYTLLCLIIVINRIYSAVKKDLEKPLFELWLAHAIADPGRVLVPPIAFLLLPKSWKSMFGKKRFESSSKKQPSAQATSDVNNSDNGTTIYGAIPVQSNDQSKLLEPE